MKHHLNDLDYFSARKTAEELHNFFKQTLRSPQFHQQQVEKELKELKEQNIFLKSQATQKALDSLRAACDTNASIGSADIKALEDAGYQISVSVAMGSEGRMGYQISILPAKAKSNGPETSNW